ncbi:MAG: extracellular solute-binding protein, partial [Lentisphaerota bacterium]
MAGEKITLRLPVNTNSSLNAGERAWNPQLYEFIRRHPELEIKGESGVAIPGQWEAGRLMAIAGGIAPDVMNVWPYQIEQYIDEGFLAPLDDFIGFDRNGDGVLDRQEVHWDGWWKIPESIRNRLFRNGHVWAIPQPLDFMMAFVYRKDLWQKAGLNPNKPPRSFDEFYRALQMLSYPDINVKGASRQLGQMALLRPGGEMLYPLIWSAGGEEILQGKTNPATGKTYWFGRDETRFADPQTGETLTRYPSEWKSNFNSPAGRKAAEFIHKLAFGKWSRDPVTGEVFDLKDNVRQGME